MSYCLNLTEIPEGFRTRGYCHLPLKAFLDMPYRQFQFYVYLLQRANWGRDPSKQGYFIFRYKSPEFQSVRYTQICVKRLQNDGYISKFWRKSGIGEGFLSKEYLGPRKGSVPLQNQFLSEAITSEHAFIFAKLILVSRLHPTWSKAKIRNHLATHYRSVNPKFFRELDNQQAVFSEPLPRRPGQIHLKPTVASPVTPRVGEGHPKKLPAASSEPQIPRKRTEVPRKSTAVPSIGEAPNIGIRTKDFYENLTIKVGDQQKRETYRIPKEVVERLRSFLISLNAKYPLSTVEANFILSVSHSLSLKDLPGESLEALVKTVYAAYWFCTQRNRNIRTKSCLWNRVYAYSLHNHGEWLWREFQSLAKPREVPKSEAKPSAPAMPVNLDPMALAIQKVHLKAEQETRNKQLQFEHFMDLKLPTWRNPGALPFKEQQRFYHQFLATWNPNQPPASFACSSVGGGRV